jgi:hypothetical protein
MSRVETPYGVQHTNIRIYVFGCKYQLHNWQDNPQTLLDLMVDKCDGLSNFSYKTIKVCGFRKVLSKTIEVHIDGIEYYNKDRLSSAEVDSLRQLIKNMLLTINQFTYSKLDVVLDRFLDNPTEGYVGHSMSEDN